MSIIYGWLSPQKQTATAYTLRQLSATHSHTIEHSHQLAAMGGYDIQKTPSSYQSNDLLVIVDGTLNWQDTELAEFQQSHSSAETLAKGFQQHGKTILNRLKGQFAIAIIKPDSQYCLLAIDPLGIRPLAYYYQDGLLVFSSQLDNILIHPQVKTKINPQGIFNYLYFQMIPSPNSIYQHIAKLQPGEMIECKQGQLQKDFYWQQDYTDSTISETKLAQQLTEQLKQSVQQSLRPEKTGAFLSGGLDSSTVCGVFQSLSDTPIDAFSIGFDAEGYDEMEFARISARHFGVKLHEYYVTPDDVLKAIPLIAATYDEPFGNASAIPAYYCAKFAKQHGIQHLLAGDGGDEIFAGNERYVKQKIFDLYRFCPEIIKQALLEPLSNIAALSKVKSYIEQAKIAMPERMETYNFLHRSPLVDIFAKDFLASIDSSQPIELLNQSYHRTNTDSLVKNMLAVDAKFTLADNDLRKVNQMCQLAGVDVSYPLLQQNLVDFSATIPSQLLIKRFELRAFFRHAIADFLAPETLSKNKQGFGLPFGVWMNTHQGLKDFADANLQSIQQRGILNPNYIKTIIEAQQQGHAAYYGVMIWLLIMLEQWLQTHE